MNNLIDKTITIYHGKEASEPYMLQLTTESTTISSINAARTENKTLRYLYLYPMNDMFPIYSLEQVTIISS
jgi:hypothetical protein